METLQTLARHRQTTVAVIVKEIFDGLTTDADVDEQQNFILWREVLLGIQGIWKDRDDLPDFQDLRRSMDRGLPPG